MSGMEPPAAAAAVAASGAGLGAGAAQSDDSTPPPAVPAVGADAAESSPPAEASSADSDAAAGKADDPRLGSIMTNDGTGDVVVIGFPSDRGTLINGGRGGGVDAPAAFRKFYGKLGCIHNAEFGISLAQLKLGDAGDAACGGTLQEAHDDLTRLVKKTLEAGSIPFVVGGSNDQSYANARGLMMQAKGKVVSVINIDAHLDVRPLIGGKRHSGSPFRLLLEDEDFKGKFIEFAAQGSQCSQAHVDYVQAKGGSIQWLHEVLGKECVPITAPPPGRGLAVAVKDGVGQAFSRALDACPGDIFVSFDIDSIRASDCPGVSCPATIGLSAQHAFRICFLAGQHPRVAMVDVSEMNPAVEGYLTPRLVVQMMYYFMLGLAVRKQSATDATAPAQAAAGGGGGLFGDDDDDDW